MNDPSPRCSRPGRPRRRSARPAWSSTAVRHPTGEDPGVGIRRWRAALAGLRTEVRVLIENTAGGRNPMARTVEQVERLFDGLSGLSDPPGFCLDTCHLHASGEPLVAATSRLRSSLGAIDLVHLNDAEGPPGTGRDRHANLGNGGSVGRRCSRWWPRPRPRA